jgi:hypothetical protein
MSAILAKMCGQIFLIHKSLIRKFFGSFRKPLIRKFLLSAGPLSANPIGNTAQKRKAKAYKQLSLKTVPKELSKKTVSRVVYITRIYLYKFQSEHWTPLFVKLISEFAEV